jgi:hypothetical protein
MKDAVVLRSSQKDVLIKEINKKLDSETKKVHLSVRPTINILASILTARPRSHPNWKIDKVYSLESKGYSAKEISDELDIPLTTVYYYLKKE